MANRPVWIYALVDPRDNAIRYIGQSCNPKRRYTQLVGKKARVSSVIKSWTAQLRKDKLKPSMIMLQETTQEFAGKIEQSWINRYNLSGNTLLNQQTFEAVDYRNNANWWNKDKETRWNLSAQNKPPTQSV